MDFLVSMDFLHNQKGYSLLSVLLSLSIVLMTLPFVTYIYQSLQQKSYQDDFSTSQFFYLLTDEVHRATSFSIVDNQLTIETISDEKVTIELYKDVIRRQVFELGHEILLRGVKQLEITETTFGFKIALKMSNGEIYEKTISFY
ncbi:competence type IV pilus minor pilin ComGF [Radiobacillus sp. PE A8.2]|uniref:competence type IV pilus minor pilin ComGF n=1 Tax=Radiobacillus sp. PE A8.2 TaxID=3380349 RepID=UPI00388E5788